MTGSWLAGSEHEDPGVAPRREMAQVADTTVERENHPVLAGCRCDHDGVALPSQVLVGDGVDVVSQLAEFGGQVVRQVLVKLELHASSGAISSRASAAP